MKNTSQKSIKRERRHQRIRAKVFGTGERPRLSVFRSNRAVYAQIIDDEKGRTIAAASSVEVKGKKLIERAAAVGKLIAEKAIKNKVKKVVFDRAGFVYTGKIKNVAEGAREGGLIF